MASTSQVISARSGFSPTARNPPYIPAALKPFAAVTPPGIWNFEIHISGELNDTLHFNMSTGEPL